MNAIYKHTHGLAMNVVGIDIITKVARLHSGTFTRGLWNHLNPQHNDVFASSVAMYHRAGGGR